jgi:hypothetical protein
VRQAIVILVLGAAFFARAASARLGETLEGCEARYGFKIGQAGADAFLFSKDGITITVWFENNRSVRELFRPAPGTSISEEEAIDLLNANSGGSSWKMQQENLFRGWRTYVRADGQAFAKYEWHGTLDAKTGMSLMIQKRTIRVPKKPSDSGF